MCVLTRTPVLLGPGPMCMNSVNFNHLPKGSDSEYSPPGARVWGHNLAHDNMLDTYFEEGLRKE